MEWSYVSANYPSLEVSKVTEFRVTAELTELLKPLVSYTLIL
jgi:hypothetical protein